MLEKLNAPIKNSEISSSGPAKERGSGSASRFTLPIQGTTTSSFGTNQMGTTTSSNGTQPNFANQALRMQSELPGAAMSSVK